MKSKITLNPKYYLIAVPVVILIVIGYIFSGSGQKTEKPEAVSIPVSGEETEKAKTFSIEKLARYDGKNGNPPYVAVDGIVYDMTGVFENGSHFGHYAGKELTNAFYMQHVKSEISKYPVVGTLE